MNEHELLMGGHTDRHTNTQTHQYHDTAGPKARAEWKPKHHEYHSCKEKNKK